MYPEKLYYCCYQFIGKIRWVVKRTWGFGIRQSWAPELSLQLTFLPFVSLVHYKMQTMSGLWVQDDAVTHVSALHHAWHMAVFSKYKLKELAERYLAVSMRK